ncbi:MAG: molybdenum cofactor guanylyltransferase [Gammaproteobacteria bacterium]|nr:molybdenum cofactor guanylyltransferase [Gammaproteobacteria bacterium]|tara:strand:- start:26859 stop:27470 length:612 start_codon:yes stop_codon:yes gene_type:complete
MYKINKKQVTTLILAGGKSTRMDGQDKGLLNVEGKYIINYIINIAEKYSKKIIVNVNRNFEKYEAMGLVICKDVLDDFQGPLAGIYSGLMMIDTEYMITLPCDGPFIRDIFFKKMISSDNNADINVAHDGKRIQPVYCMIKKSVTNNLESFLKTDQRKIDKWFENNITNLIDFSQYNEMFVNINDKNELEKYKKQILNNIKNE